MKMMGWCDTLEGRTRAFAALPFPSTTEVRSVINVARTAHSIDSYWEAQ